MKGKDPREVNTMDRMEFRPILAPLLGLALCFTMSPRPGAAVNQAFVAHYVARAVDVTEAKDAGRIDVYIERWSTNEERDTLVGALKHGPDTLLSTLESVRRRAGVLLIPGVHGDGARVRSPRPRNLLYAQQLETQAGRHIVFAADRHVGLGQYERWGAPDDPEFTLIDIRFGPDGTGIGKAAAPTQVAYDAAANILTVKDFGKEPVRLRDVQSQAADRIVTARYYGPR